MAVPQGLDVKSINVMAQAVLPGVCTHVIEREIYISLVDSASIGFWGQVLLGVTHEVENGCWQTLVPHKILHGTISIPVQCSNMAANVGNCGGNHTQIPLIL